MQTTYSLLSRKRPSELKSKADQSSSTTEQRVRWAGHLIVIYPLNCFLGRGSVESAKLKSTRQPQMRRCGEPRPPNPDLSSHRNCFLEATGYWISRPKAAGNTTRMTVCSSSGSTIWWLLFWPVAANNEELSSTVETGETVQHTN